MESREASTFINNNNFVPRKISKKIINFLNFDNNFEDQKVLGISKYLTLKNLNNIRKKFQKYKNGKKNNSTRNSIVYKYINHLSKNTNLNVFLNKNNDDVKVPKINGVKLSLSTLLLILENKKKFKNFNFYFGFEKILLNCNFKKPSIKNYNLIFNLVKDLPRNETIYIVTPVCPDYSYEKKDQMYNFTFENLNEDIGLVSKRLLIDIKEIHNFFNLLKIKFKHIITVGDFEAYSKSNQRRMKLTEAEYLHKINKSQKKISKTFKYKDCIADKEFSKIFGNKNIWLKRVKKFKEILRRKNLGNTDLSNKSLYQILSSRIPLYKKWYGELSNKQYLDILIDQASEYAAMGSLVKSKFKNTIILGADHHRMADFYNLEKDNTKPNLPVLYLKKNYIT
jgi:hypothetical protein